MNKTAKIIISIMSLVMVFLILFSNIQASEAKKQKATTLILAEENKELKSRIELEATRAEKLAAEAIMAQNRAEETTVKLEECQNSK